MITGNNYVPLLPANTLIQPMDQVIESKKQRYRKCFFQKLAWIGDEFISVKQFWKSYAVKGAIFNVAEAWQDITEETLKKGLNNMWSEIENENKTINESGNDEKIFHL